MNCKSKNIILEIIENRSIIKNLAKNDFKTKFAGAYLGGAFGFVKALILVCVFSAIIGAAEQYIPKDSAFSEMVGSSYAIDFINDINPFN